MNGRIEARAKPVKPPAEAARQGPVALTPPRDPALGIVLAVIVSAVLWPALFVLWFYLWR